MPVKALSFDPSRASDGVEPTPDDAPACQPCASSGATYTSPVQFQGRPVLQSSHLSNTDSPSIRLPLSRSMSRRGIETNWSMKRDRSELMNSPSLRYQETLCRPDCNSALIISSHVQQSFIQSLPTGARRAQSDSLHSDEECGFSNAQESSNDPEFSSWIWCDSYLFRGESLQCELPPWHLCWPKSCVACVCPLQAAKFFGTPCHEPGLAAQFTPLFRRRCQGSFSSVCAFLAGLWKPRQSRVVVCLPRSDHAEHAGAFPVLDVFDMSSSTCFIRTGSLTAISFRPGTQSSVHFYLSPPSSSPLPSRLWTTRPAAVSGTAGSSRMSFSMPSGSATCTCRPGALLHALPLHLSHTCYLHNTWDVYYNAWVTPLACGPGSPELSKSCSDMARKLVTTHYNAHRLQGHVQSSDHGAKFC